MFHPMPFIHSSDTHTQQSAPLCPLPSPHQPARHPPSNTTMAKPRLVPTVEMAVAVVRCSTGNQAADTEEGAVYTRGLANPTIMAPPCCTLVAGRQSKEGLTLTRLTHLLGHSHTVS